MSRVESLSHHRGTRIVLRLHDGLFEVPMTLAISHYDEMLTAGDPQDRI